MGQAHAEVGGLTAASPCGDGSSVIPTGQGERSVSCLGMGNGPLLFQERGYSNATGDIVSDGLHAHAMGCAYLLRST